MKKYSWSKEKCAIEAQKYNSRSKWSKSSQSSYNLARINGWLDECCDHMNTPRGYWDKERCLIESKKYNSKNEWSKLSQTSYGIARRNGWLEECSKHMIKIQKPSGYWNKERCLTEGKNFNSKNEWQKSCQSSYYTAWKKGWLEECCKHMIVRDIKPRGYWDKERCLIESKKYNNISKWQKSSQSSYNSARKKGWLEECSKHMIKIQKPNGYLNRNQTLTLLIEHFLILKQNNNKVTQKMLGELSGKNVNTIKGYWKEILVQISES